MLWSTLFKIGKYNVLLKIQIMKKLEVRTRGFSSRVSDTSLYVIPLDFDNIEDETRAKTAYVRTPHSPSLSI